MSGNKIIELRAQINILGYLIDHLCNGELPEAGRKAVRQLQNSMINQINEIYKGVGMKTDNQIGNYKTEIK